MPLSSFIFLIILISVALLTQHTAAFSKSPDRISFGKKLLRTPKLPAALNARDTKLFILPDAEGETNPLVAVANSKVQGYMSSDLSSNEDGKQGRVFGYILFALVPVLFLVPFFMSRGFDPPVDPDMAPMTAISSAATTNALKERIY